MSVWLSESEYRQSGAASVGLTLNVAFLQEIKQDNVEFRELLARVRFHFQNVEPSQKNRPVETARLLSELRDELETYFALEEFYGYFQNAEVNNPSVCHQADQLRTEHELLFLELNQLVDSTEQIVYHECSSELTFDDIVDQFESFLAHLQRHEHKEMELVMRLFNEEIGVGD